MRPDSQSSPGYLLALVLVASPFFRLLNVKVFVFFPLSLETGIYLLPVEYLRRQVRTPAREAIEFYSALPDYIAGSFRNDGCFLAQANQSA